MHWHIDYLLHYGQVICVHTYAAEKNAECILSQKIGNIKNAVILVSGFGSSDCSCASHLYFFRITLIPDYPSSRLMVSVHPLPNPSHQGRGKNVSSPSMGRLGGVLNC